MLELGRCARMQWGIGPRLGRGFLFTILKTQDLLERLRELVNSWFSKTILKSDVSNHDLGDGFREVKRRKNWGSEAGSSLLTQLPSEFRIFT